MIFLLTVADIFISTFQQLGQQIGIFFPKVIIAVVIWLVGNYFIGLAVKVLRRIHVKGLKWDVRVINLLVRVAVPVFKFLLVMVVLDYMGIGRTVIGALVNGLSLAIAISLGMAFGRALEEDARGVIGLVREQLRR